MFFRGNAAIKKRLWIEFVDGQSIKPVNIDKTKNNERPRSALDAVVRQCGEWRFTRMSEIETIVKELAEAYHLEKNAKKAKDETRKQFFESVTKELSEGELAEDIVIVDADDEEEAEIRAKAKYPTYSVEASRKHPDVEGKYEVIIRELPEYKSFSVSVDGEIWQRQIVIGSPVIDEIRLKEQDPELYEEVTALPTERVMKPLQEIDDVALARLQKYVTPGKVTQKLPAPKEDK